MKSTLKNFLNQYAPKKRYYFALCFFIVLTSFIQKTGAIYWKIGYYTYEYGLINPWVVIYNNHTMGMKRLAYMLINSSMGVEWYPQYIFLDAALVYLVIALIGFIYEKLFETTRNSSHK